MYKQINKQIKEHSQLYKKNIFKKKTTKHVKIYNITRFYEKCNLNLKKKTKNKKAET